MRKMRIEDERRRSRKEDKERMKEDLERKIKRG
jgi:hypothetical protein